MTDTPTTFQFVQGTGNVIYVTPVTGTSGIGGNASGAIITFTVFGT